MKNSISRCHDLNCPFKKKSSNYNTSIECFYSLFEMRELRKMEGVTFNESNLNMWVRKYEFLNVNVTIKIKNH